MDEPINPDPKAEAWASKNSWFGTDRAMTYTAFEIHKDLTEKEGYDPNSNEYYAEVDRRIKVDFPHKFGNTEISKRPPCSDSCFCYKKRKAWSQNCETHIFTGSNS
jgi:GH15 family glucan-1,4-alpha-glucosidase